LANEAGVRQASSVRSKAATQNPTLESRDKVASALDVAVAELLA
jgi:hypothetical protein